VPCFASLAALGVAAQALAQNGEQFAAARFLLGIGSSVNWMGAVALCAVWYPPDRFSTRLSWIYAFGQTGTFLAATPLAVVSGNVGWRWAFAAMAVLTAVIGALFWICVRDAPTDHPAPKRSSRDFHDMLGGLVQVWRTPGLLPVLAMNAVATAMIATILGLWAGPYLADVYGLDATARGNVLLAMAIAHLLGSLAFGPLDRIFDTRKWVVVSGAAGTILVLIGLASISKPPFWLAVSLLVLLCFVTAYSVIIMAHGRSLFAPDMLGRGLTLINFAPIVGLVGLPIVTGAIIQAFPAQGMARPAIAYQCSFAVMALALAAGLLCYLKSKDIKPGRILR
jgi:predicted MFS family arabinose efflux permease